MNSAITLRPMAPGDYAAVRALWQAIPGMGLNPHDDSEAGIRRFLARNPGLSFIALEGDALIGTLLAGHDGRRGGVYHACVAEEHRGRGVGRLLLEAALSALRAEGIYKTRLLCYRDNEIGNRFWRQMGWTHREDTCYYDYVFADMDG